MCAGEAVFARCLSSLKDERVQASKVLHGPASSKYTGDKAEFIEHIRKVRPYFTVLQLMFDDCIISNNVMLLIAGTVCVQDHILHARLHVVA